MVNNSKNIGILFVENAGDGLTQDYFASVIDSFKKEVEAEGYSVTFINSSDRCKNRATYLEQIKQHGFAGLMVTCVNLDEKEMQEVVASGIPIVSIDEKIDAPNATLVSSDNTNGMGKLVDYAVSMGHSKIAYIYGDYNYVTKVRIHGFEEACKKNGIDIPEDFLLPGKYRDTDKASYYTDYLLRLAEPPSCIFYSDDLTAIAGMNTIRARGLEIPRDVAVAGYDGIRVAMQYEPRLTTIRQRSDKIGLTAGRILVDRIEKKDQFVNQDVVIDTDLEEGRTVG